ncbi:hypothetical protein AB0G74_17145 [Streptomyces sp. NPDC020875]|uniref:hypothetical protein n=1 Tax=Streptomyces sp. NPDC020875 TaxID=3154898 RepID=UPI0033E42D75
MTGEGLTQPPPPARTAICCRCGRPTYAPVAVRYVGPGDGRAAAQGTTVYACPLCAPILAPGPIPDEMPELC